MGMLLHRNRKLAEKQQVTKLHDVTPKVEEEPVLVQVDSPMVDDVQVETKPHIVTQNQATARRGRPPRRVNG